MARDQIHDRWSEIVAAMIVASIPRDELTILAIVAGAQHLTQRLPSPERKPIGFAPAGRKETR